MGAQIPTPAGWVSFTTSVHVHAHLFDLLDGGNGLLHVEGEANWPDLAVIICWLVCPISSDNGQIEIEKTVHSRIQGRAIFLSGGWI